MAALLPPEVGRRLTQTALAVAHSERVREAVDLASLRWRRRPAVAPAAIRVERSRGQGGRSGARQTAVTVWFGEGPSLPTPGGRRGGFSGVRAGAGIAGAVMLGVVAAVAAHRENGLPIGPRHPPPRLPPPGPSR